MTMTIGPFNDTAQRESVRSAVSAVTDSHIGKTRPRDKPLTVTGTEVRMSFTDGDPIILELEGPDTQMSKARKKIEDSVKPFGVNVLLSIHQERKK
jgi:hypothetical protein